MRKGRNLHCKYGDLFTTSADKNNTNMTKIRFPPKTLLRSCWFLGSKNILRVPRPLNVIKITCRHFVALKIIDKIESFITFNVDLRHINKAVHEVCNQVFSQALCEWKASKEQEQPERREERTVAQIFNLPRTASTSMFSLSFSGKTSSCTGNSPRTSRSTFPGLTDSITRRFIQEVIGRTE